MPPTPLLPWDPSTRSALTHPYSHPQDLDAECLRRTELETKLKGLQSFVELMKTVYEQVRRRASVPQSQALTGPRVRDAGEGRAANRQRSLLVPATDVTIS